MTAITPPLLSPTGPLPVPPSRFQPAPPLARATHAAGNKALKEEDKEKPEPLTDKEVSDINAEIRKLEVQMITGRHSPVTLGFVIASLAMIVFSLMLIAICPLGACILFSAAIPILVVSSFLFTSFNGKVQGELDELNKKLDDNRKFNSVKK